MAPSSRLVRLQDEDSVVLVYPEQGFQLHGFEVVFKDGRQVQAIYGPPGPEFEPWDRRYGNPILFPNIVDANNSQANSWDFEGRALPMPKHGWARDMYWHVSVASSEQSLPVWCVWSPAPDAPYVCLEPWTDSPNPLNRAAPRRLLPGAQHRYEMTISLSSMD